MPMFGGIEHTREQMENCVQLLVEGRTLEAAIMLLRESHRLDYVIGCERKKREDNNAS